MRWLLDRDLKPFIPGCIENVIVGAQLADERTQVAELVKLFKKPQDERTMLGLHAQLDQLRKDAGVKMVSAQGTVSPPHGRPRSISSMTTSGGVRIADDARRALGANGWSFEREMTEWRLYHEAFVHRVVLQHLRDRLMSIREVCTLLTLIISTVTTLVTSAAAGIIGGGVSATSGTNAPPAEGLGVFITWIEQNSSYILLLFSLATTIISGFVQTQSAFWKRLDKERRTHRDRTEITPRSHRDRTVDTARALTQTCVLSRGPTSSW